MTERDYVTDEAELLHDIRELLAILVMAQCSPPSASSAITDPQVRKLVQAVLDPDRIPRVAERPPA